MDPARFVLQAIVAHYADGVYTFHSIIRVYTVLSKMWAVSVQKYGQHPQ